MTDFSYQLYSSRNAPPVADVLVRLATLGYKRVEGYGGLFGDDTAVANLRAALDANHLVMHSSHIGFDLIEGDPSKTIDIAKTLGLREVYAPHLAPDQRPNDAAGWRAFGVRMVEAAKPLQDAGLTVGWHNHDFEFNALPTGELPMDLMLDGNDLAFEFDVAWSHVAGLNPLDVIAKHGGRITAAHVKDRAPQGENADEDGWADVGHGIMDCVDIYASLQSAACKNFVMEHDKPSDDQRFASRSIAYMQTLT